MRKYILILFLLCLHGLARGQTSDYIGFYWFDNQQGTPTILPKLEGRFDIDASSLADGLHNFHYVVAKKDGGISSPSMNYFVKLPPRSTTLKGFYWFDNETASHEATTLNGTFEVDASMLSDGFHQFSYIVTQINGGLAKPASCYFLKVTQVKENDSLTCICSVDGQLRHIEKLSQQGGVIHWDLDMQDLADGIHKIQLQAVTKSGALSSSFSSYFMRITSQEELNEMHCVYAIDNDSFHTNSEVLSNNSAYHFDLDLSDLDDGLHYITFLLHNDRGTSTIAQTRFFVKVPLGGNGITQYQFWLNDDDISDAKTITLPQKVNPLQLVSLLPVESRPLRSSLFQFDMSSGQPKLYAKNTIHLRFYDVAMRFSDAVKDFTDYSVSQDVNVIKELESGVSETTKWPKENEIRWYQVTAERGDSLRFKLDHAATLQLFAPSGKEVYNVSGAESVKWGGLHAAETGVFYLALHDVTATQGDEISIDYEHIDKYAVLRQDVTVVGNGGCSTITFEGNGFDELTSVDLVWGSNIITSMEIGHESNASTSVKFDFMGVALGQYKAIFHFTEGKLTVEKCIKVEEAIDIAFDLSVSYASQFLIGTSNDYIFKVHNNGNMTAYNVPMAILIYTPDSSSLSMIEISGYDTKKHIQKILKDYYTDSLKNIIAQKSSESGDLYFFNTANNVGYIDGHTYMHYAFITPTLRPKTTETYAINVKTTKETYVYMWIPQKWENEDSEAGATSRRKSKQSDCDQKLKNSWIRCKNCYYELKYTGGTTMCDGCIPPSPGGDCSNNKGGGSNPVTSLDPNDINGYTAESGSHAVKDGLTDVFYRIEFENDPEFATASAHQVVVTDTLDATKFDLSTFAPTRVKIGEKEAELTGDKNFVTTIDMRPEINAIAQVEGTYDENKGIAKWYITSLDPMTMEPTNDVMRGVLPVNYNGSGIGEVLFDISLRSDLAHGTEINNRAAIVFDTNDIIMTPTWRNTIDRVAPESNVTNVKMLNDSTASVSIKVSDELSGPWRYDVYVQYGEGSAWFLGAKDVPIDKEASVRVYESIDHGFYAVVTDSAGNVEQKKAAREFTFEIFSSQIETNTKVQLAQGWNWMSHNQDAPLLIEAIKPKAQQIISQTADLHKESQQIWTGYLEELLPTEMYKVQMVETDELSLSGLLFNAAFRSVPLKQGWNWIGYPVANAMSISEALSKLKAEEGDAIISQDGIAIFSDGHWTGTLSTMHPGIGYMYRSVSDKNLFLNASAQYSARKMRAAKAKQETAWTIDKRSYPDVMGFIADLYKNESIKNSDDYIVGAFCNEECRGIAQISDGHLMINVYGKVGETITFRVMHCESGEVQMIAEQEPLCSDLLGTIQRPYELHIGNYTGIISKNGYHDKNSTAVYDVQGRKINKNQMKKGVYVVVEDNHNQAKKVVK